MTTFIHSAHEYCASPYVPGFFRFLFPYKTKKLPFSTQNPLLFFLLQNKLSLALINWVFQGIRGMGVADLTGKIFLELLVFATGLILLNSAFPFRLIVAFLIAHTVNWLFNSHFWVLGRYLGITRTNPVRFIKYLERLAKRLDDCVAIDPVLVIGGASRKQGVKPTSDVDIFFIRNSGFINGINAIIVTCRERALAFVCKFPLHLLLYDNIEMMNIHRKDETPFVLKDDQGRASDHYSAQCRETYDFIDYCEEATKTA